MLTLTRSVGETIRIGDDIEVHVVEVRGGTVRLGFKAPREVAIHREEVYRQIAEANLLAAQVTADSLGALAAFAPSAAVAADEAEQAEEWPRLDRSDGGGRAGLGDRCRHDELAAADRSDTGNSCRSPGPQLRMTRRVLCPRLPRA
jgi:carbon storage regulator